MLYMHSFKKQPGRSKVEVSLLSLAESFIPKQVEYDWVCDNIFALEGKGNIWACGRTSGACVRIVRQTKPLTGEMRFALDPKRG